MTIVEVMISLFIFTTIASFMFISLHAVQKGKETEYFFEQFSTDLLRYQHFAILNNKKVTFKLNNSKNSYSVYTSSFYNPILIREIPANMTINYGTMGSTFSYLPSGNISHAGTMFFYTKTKTFKMVFLLGKGRFYVERQ
jgi:competence protein ComGD